MATLLGGGKFEIQLKFNNKENTFLSGGRVEAIIRVLLPDEVLLEDMIISLKGFAKTDWQDTIGTESVYRGTSQEYFEKHYAIPVAKNTENLRVFTSGEHLYPVKFELPAMIPSSFEGKYGHIRYIMSGKAIIGNHIEVLGKTNVPVSCRVDLNLEQVVGMSKSMTATQDIFCLFCGGGHVNVAFRIDKRGYIPGETIVMNGQVNNHSRKTIRQTKCSLIRTMIYYEDSRTKHVDREVIASVKHGTIKSRNADPWENEELVIPEDTVPELDHCGIMRVQYKLKIEVSLTAAFPSTYKMLTFNIKMGTIKARKPGDYFSGFMGFVPDR